MRGIRRERKRKSNLILRQQIIMNVAKEEYIKFSYLNIEKPEENRKSIVG